MKISTWPRHRHILAQARSAVNIANFLPGVGLNIIPALGLPLYLQRGDNTAFPAAAFCCPTCSSTTSWRPTWRRRPRCGTATFPAAATCRPPCSANCHLAGESFSTPSLPPVLDMLSIFISLSYCSFTQLPSSTTPPDGPVLGRGVPQADRARHTRLQELQCPGRGRLGALLAGLQPRLHHVTGPQFTQVSCVLDAATESINFLLLRLEYNTSSNIFSGGGVNC